MAWTAPRTWVALETVTAAQLNTHLRDNMLETAPAKVTTAGDMVYATAANALARLAKGTAMQVLGMNSGATAPEWRSPGQALRTANISGVDITATSMTDVAGLSQAITTRGGRLRISLVPENTSGDACAVIVFQDSGTPTNMWGLVRAVVGATNLGSISAQIAASSAEMQQFDIPPSAFVWDYAVVAGTYTVKVQAQAASTEVTVRFDNVALLVEELPYA